MSTAIHLPPLSPVRNLHHSITLCLSLGICNVIVFSRTVSFLILFLFPQFVKTACATDMCANYDKSSAQECAVCLYDRTLGKYSCRFHTSLFLHHCFCWQNENTTCKQMQENTEHCILLSSFSFCLFTHCFLTIIKNIIYPSVYFFFFLFFFFYCLAFP